MNVLHLVSDGAVAAAELLVLLFAASVPSPEPHATASQSIEPSVHLHRSIARDMRLLGTVAEVPGVLRLHNEGNPANDAAADDANREVGFDLVVSRFRVTRPRNAALAAVADAACDPAPRDGHVRLTEDEAIAAAVWATPRNATSAHAVARLGEVDGPLPTGLLVDQGDHAFLLVSPNVAATSAILALRPVTGSGAEFALGKVDHGTTIVVPLASRQQLESLAAGAIELELRVADTTIWTTVTLGRVDAGALLSATTE